MTSRIFLFIGTLLFAFSASGQAQKHPNKSWAVSANVMPSVTFEVENFSDVNFPPVIGLRLERMWSERLRLGSGLNFMLLDAYNGRTFGVDCPSPNNDCQVYTKRSYIEIPLFVSFNFSEEDSKVKSYLSIGAITTFSIHSLATRVQYIDGQRNKFLYEDNTLRYQQNYLSVAFGTEFHLSEKLDFLLEPTFRYSINEFFVFDYNPAMIIGINTGVRLNY